MSQIVKPLSVFLLLICLIAFGVVAKSADKRKKPDCLGLITAKIKKSDCLRVDFTAYTKSDIFESVDTLAGSALMSADKRYRVTLGPDWFLSTGDSVYVYAREQQQVSVQAATEADIPTELILLRQLDDLYTSELLSGDSLYQLTRKPDADPFFPEGLRLACSRSREAFNWLEFRSENGDFTTIMIKEMRSLAICQPSSFVATIPDGTEIIHLP